MEFPKIIPASIVVGKSCVKCSVVCPYCAEKHTHGLGELGGPVLWGHRGADCGRGGYIIVKSLDD